MINQENQKVTQTPSAEFDPNRAIRAINELPISAENAGRVMIQSMLQKKIDELKEQLAKLPKDDFVDIGDNILFPTNPTNRFLVMDFLKVPLDCHSSYGTYYFGYSRSLHGEPQEPQKDKSAKSAPKLPEQYPWALCKETEFKAMQKTPMWDDLLGFLENDAQGITLGNNSTPTRYYALNSHTAFKQFNSYDHDNVVDLYVARFPKDKNGLEWVIENSSIKLEGIYLDLAAFHAEDLIMFWEQDQRYAIQVNSDEIDRMVDKILCGEVLHLGSLSFSADVLRKRTDGAPENSPNLRKRKS